MVLLNEWQPDGDAAALYLLYGHECWRDCWSRSFVVTSNSQEHNSDVCVCVYQVVCTVTVCVYRVVCDSTS